MYALAKHALKDLGARYGIHKVLPPSAVQALTDYQWLGNVRELHNVMERLVILYAENKITREHVLDEMGMAIPSPAKVPCVEKGKYKGALDDIEKGILCQVMEQHGGNLNLAAAELGIHRTTLLRKLRKYKLFFPKDIPIE
jgi:transcriptional regulator with PAS, ATPase and Fis domain